MAAKKKVIDKGEVVKAKPAKAGVTTFKNGKETKHVPPTKDKGVK